MGYYTKYKLSVISMHDDERFKLLEGALTERFEDELDHQGGLVFETEEPCKWYDHEKDVTKLSKEHPDVVFMLEGEGEETGDIWRAFAKDGKYVRQEPEILFPEPPKWAR